MSDEKPVDAFKVETIRKIFDREELKRYWVDELKQDERYREYILQQLKALNAGATETAESTVTKARVTQKIGRNTKFPAVLKLPGRPPIVLNKE